MAISKNVLLLLVLGEESVGGGKRVLDGRRYRWLLLIFGIWYG